MTRDEQRLLKEQKEKEFIESIKDKRITQEEKKKYRTTDIWKNFRKSFYIIGQKVLKNGKKKDIIGVDFLTHSKLSKNFNLHHKKLSSDKYTEIENRDNFVSLNQESHECTHWFYTQMCKDRTFEERFLSLIHEMGELNDWKDVKDFNS